MGHASAPVWRAWRRCVLSLLWPFAVVLLAASCLTLAAMLRRVSYKLKDARAENEQLNTRFNRVEAEALRLQTVRRDFVANISHELRTPLASIRLLVETLEGGALHDDTVAAEFTRKIGQETEHLIGMTQELLDLARLEAAPSMRPDVLDPPAIVTRVIERMRELALDKHVTLRTDLAPNLPAVWADAEQVSRIFLNLLHNAVKFTPDGGEVTISARAELGMVSFSVTDTGSGIPAGEEVRIFERFYKADAARQRGGAGLGLSIARHLVEAQGGQIWARNGEDRGACFTFTLLIAGTYALAARPE